MENYERTSGQQCTDSADATAVLIIRMEEKLDQNQKGIKEWIDAINVKLETICGRQMELALFNAEHKEKISRIPRLEEQIISINQRCAEIQSGKRATDDLKKGSLPFIEKYQTLIATFGTSFLTGLTIFFLAVYLHVFH